MELIKVTALFRRHRAGGNRRLLSAVARTQGRTDALAAAPGRTIAQPVCLALDPASDRRRPTYAAYGGVYVAVALLWLRMVDGIPLTRWDLPGAAIALAGMAIIALQPLEMV